ncbi:MAG: ABC transporter permease subunit [Bdellovibrionales bacterium]|nr:ABC transporter permease [Bdellovibrionales bacterium]NQZ18146.1 ABC transporter permease subunit [Bdellovibrionales bacterium]
MIRPIHIVAKNTFIEVIRDRVLYFLVFFSIFFMLLCFAVGQLSYDEIFRLSVSLGLSGIHICFCGLTIFLGSSLFYREIEKKTIYTLLARPVSRTQYLAGKFLGLLTVLSLLLLGFILCFTVVEFVLGMPILLTTYYSFLGIILEATILLAVTFFFSSFARPFMAITGTLSFFLVGHWVSNLEFLMSKSTDPGFLAIGNILVRTFPHLDSLNWRPNAIAKVAVNPVDLNYGLYLSLVWSALFFVLAIILFRRKDFD